MSTEHLTRIELDAIAHRLETMADGKHDEGQIDSLSRTALEHAARIVRALPGIVAAGNAVVEEVGTVDPAYSFCEAWELAVEAYR